MVNTKWRDVRPKNMRIWQRKDGELYEAFGIVGSMVTNGQILEGTLGEILRRVPELEHLHVRVIVDDSDIPPAPNGPQLEKILDELSGPVNGTIPEKFGREDIYGDHA